MRITTFSWSDIGAFNEVAHMVNEIEPDIQWRSLGDIARHLYLTRLREDGNYDVLCVFEGTYPRK